MEPLTSGERRARALLDLAIAIFPAGSLDEVLVLATRSLAGCDDLPFVLAYALESQRSRARLVACSGLERGTALAPEEVHVDEAVPRSWPFGEVVRGGGPLAVDFAATVFASSAPHAKTARTVVLAPVTPAGDDGAVAIVVSGVNTDSADRAFHEEVATTIASGMAAVRGRVDERSLREELSTFLPALGHALRNSLSAISTAACLLSRRAGETASLVKPVGRIVASTERMERVISQALDAASIRSGRALRLEREDVDLSEVSRQVMEDVGPACAVAPQLHLKGDTRGTWDRDRLSRAISTLVLNGCSHGLKGAPVQILIDGSGSAVVRFEVRNQGVIPPDELAVLFEPRLHSEGADKRPGSSGLGLGLFILREVVHAHGGTIEVTSEDGPGTRFSVELPRANPGALRRGP
jgi:signal transduction histidine kinase